MIAGVRKKVCAFAALTCCGIFVAATLGFGEEQRSMRFRGYGKYSKNFKILCEKIAKDGRVEVMYHLFDVGADRERSDCIACKPLMKTFAIACKPKLKWEALGKQEKVRREREPTLEVLDMISRIFIAIAQDEQVNRETVKAIHVMGELLRDRVERTEADYEYSTILAEYIEAPFAELERVMQKAERKAAEESGEVAGNEAVSGPRVDELF